MASAMIATVSPSTNQIILESPEATVESARSAASASATAFRSWSKTSLEHRKAIVSKALGLVQDRKEQLARELTEQMGRPIAFGAKEIETMQKRADYLMDTAAEALADIPGRTETGFQRWVSRDPVGPTLIAFPWNFPYLVIVNALVPALLAGNTVLLKPSPQTPLVGIRFAEIFAEAGLPDKALQVIQCGNQATLGEIVKISDIKLITFTGSTAGGLALRAAAAHRVVPINLELGGNDPAYVRPDADLKYVAAQLVDGAVFNSGQSCCAIERVYVHQSVHDAFVKELQDELATYVLGDSFDQRTNVGPVVSQSAVATIAAHVEDALQNGALDVTPKNDSFTKLPPNGNYVVPKILTNVKSTMRVMREETFGPIIPVQAVQSDEEAIEHMNNSDYGLTASVWTRDLARGTEILKDLEAGTVFINRCDYPNPDLAWTGWKNSGLGCTLGPKAFDFFVRLRSFHIKEKQG